MKRAVFNERVLAGFDARRSGAISSEDSSVRVDTDSLALAIIEDNTRPDGGVLFGYCACGYPVTARTAKRAQALGRSPRCATCAAKVAHKSRDERVYLCAICRDPLKGNRAAMARANTKRGSATTCGRSECMREQRRERAAKMFAGVEPERRRESGRKAAMRITAEQRSAYGQATADASRAWHASRTPEQKSEARRKAWKTRLAHKAADK